MTTLSLLKYIGGYLEVVLSGYAPERFLNLCSNHNILIWNLRKEEDVYRFFISIRAFRSIRPFVSKTGCRIRILRKIGFPFWMNRYRKRKCFLMGVIFAAGLVWFLSRFLWNVEVDGNSSVTTETVLTFLDEKDCGYGDRICTIDCEQLERDLRAQFPEIIWASVQIYGTKMTVLIKENLVQQEAMEELPYEASDLIAEEDATVESIITRNGTPLVKNGDAVKAGDILVSGRIDLINDSGEQYAYEYCNADADIYLLTEYPYQDKFSLAHEEKRMTGAEKKRYSIDFFGKVITLPTLSSGFECADKTTDYKQLCLHGDFYLPLGIYYSTLKEYRTEQAIYTKEQAEAVATENFNIYLSHLAEKNIQILEKNVIIDMDDKNCIMEGIIKVRKKAALRQETEQLTAPDTEDTEEGLVLNEFE